jgi:hypothetical protein
MELNRNKLETNKLIEYKYKNNIWIINIIEAI